MKAFFVTLVDGSDYKILARDKEDALKRVQAGEGILNGVFIVELKGPKIEETSIGDNSNV
jgi:hypothetical protein